MQSIMSLRTGAPLKSSKCSQRAARALVATRASTDPLVQKPAVRPVAPTTAPAPAVPAVPAAPEPSTASSESAPTGVTIEYQRQQAKAMQQYFIDQKLAEATVDAQVFGWTPKNEIGNGRWVMMGLAIGLLTEYATAVNFIDQIKLMVSYLGIADIYD